MTDHFDDVVHVAPTPLGSPLEELGAETVVGFSDRLTHGPASDAPKRHRKGRLDYWRRLYESLFATAANTQVGSAMDELERGYVSTEQLGSAAAQAADGRRIVVWTTPTFEDRLFLWFAFSALVNEGVPCGQIATAEPRVELDDTADDALEFAELSSLDAQELATGFDQIFYPELIYVQAGANLWETFASASPRQLALSIPHTTKFFPQFAAFAEDYGAVFPVVDTPQSDTLRVSAVDQMVLGCLATDRCQSPAVVIDAGVVERYRCMDELAVLARLRAWSRCSPDEPYVQATRRADGPDVVDQFGYRLTERGRALVDQGFEPGDDLPTFLIGDARLYAGSRPWVRVIDADNWWFERFEPPTK